MKKFKEVMKERSFVRGSLFLVFNAFLLYVLYFIIKNFDIIAITVGKALSSLISAFSPLFIGLIIAYLLNPLVTIIDKRLMRRMFFRIPDDPIKAEKRRNLSRFVSVLLTFLIVIAAIAAIIYGFAVMILGQFVFTDFSAMAQSVIQTFMNYEVDLRQWIAQNLPEGFMTDKFMEVANSIISWISDNFSATNAITAVTGAVGSVINVAIGAIVSIYLMKDKDFFLGLWRKFLHLLLPQRANAAVTETLSEVNGVLSQFVRGALLDALIVAILSSIGLSIIGLDFAVFIGVFAGISNVIPYFGPILGMIPAFIIGWFTEDFTQAAVAVIILIVVQQIDSNIIYPKVVGSSTGLHPLTVLLAVSVFGYFGGIIWMILAVPIAGVIQAFIVKWAYRKERRLEAVEAESAASNSGGANAPADSGGEKTE
ncbi:AI-2E family transporter [Anaerovorax odorimutans]|uniref:AI-2E family transporter n=1 Tax=Anaerovorax odorimutans TaxID=109327 RepID=A0ABT1RTN6_9FIRM|nr:AI-2E family transporter [Anaerovorax odorimutans]MCQ4638506.1 AI-2E family transporter [Anaerovorax odorimutans]